MKVDEALYVLQEHVAKHSNNKYQKTIIDTDRALTESKFTLLTAQKYVARYLATEGEKNANVEDLKKAAHFLLFEIQNRINQLKDASTAAHDHK